MSDVSTIMIFLERSSRTRLDTEVNMDLKNKIDWALRDQNKALLVDIIQERSRKCHQG